MMSDDGHGGRRLLKSAKEAGAGVSQQVAWLPGMLMTRMATKIPPDDAARFEYLFRPKRKWELALLSATVCGIELCYAAETAFVGPLLMIMGSNRTAMSLVWGVSPLFGLFITPILGSLSDACTSKYGRRRPFMVGLALAILCGLLLVSTSSYLAAEQIESQRRFANDASADAGRLFYAHQSFGHVPQRPDEARARRSVLHQPQPSLLAAAAGAPAELDAWPKPAHFQIGPTMANGTAHKAADLARRRNGKMAMVRKESGETHSGMFKPGTSALAMTITILGVVLLDFGCDAAQSPCRTYLLDVCTPEDLHPGLTFFTISAGLGGSVGYIIGSFDWSTMKGSSDFFGHIRSIFAFVAVVFTVFTLATINVFKEPSAADIEKIIEIYDLTNEEEASATGEDGHESATKAGDDPLVQTQSYNDTNDINDGDNDLGEGGGGMGKREFRKSTKGLQRKRSAKIVKQQLRAKSNSTKRREQQMQTEAPQSQQQAMQQQQQKQQHQQQQQQKQQQQVDYTTTNQYGYQQLDDIDGFMPYSNTNPNANVPASHVVNYGTQQPTLPNPSHTQHHQGSLMTRSQPRGHKSELQLETGFVRYLRSIRDLPRSMLQLVITNFCCWASLVCYSLYFTEFVGSAVFLGDPKAVENSEGQNRYQQGVRVGAFGMSLYSAACCIYSMYANKISDQFGLKSTYVGGCVVYAVGMFFIALFRTTWAAILLSPTAGIMYATLFTMPYLLVGKYHANQLFEDDSSVAVAGVTTDEHNFYPDDDDVGRQAANVGGQSRNKASGGGGGGGEEARGLGTDVAVVGSMVFAAQIVVSLMAALIQHLFDSSTTIMLMGSGFAAVSAYMASTLYYPSNNVVAT